jgi:hypothetical protein
MSHFVSVLCDRDRVRERIEGRLKTSSKGQSVTGAQNHHDLFLQTGTGCDQQKARSRKTPSFCFTA